MFDVLGAASSVGRGHLQRSACVLVFVPWLAMPGVAQRELRTITYYRGLDTAHLRLLAGKKKLKSFGRAEKPVGKFLRGMNLSYEQVRVAEQGRIARRAGRCRNWCAGEDTVARLGGLVALVARRTSSRRIFGKVSLWLRKGART